MKQARGCPLPWARTDTGSTAHRVRHGLMVAECPTGLGLLYATLVDLAVQIASGVPVPEVADLTVRERSLLTEALDELRLIQSEVADGQP